MPFSARDAWLAKEAAKKKDVGESPTPTAPTSNKEPLPFQSQEKARANLASKKDLGPEKMYETGSSIIPESFRQPFVPSMKQRYPGPAAVEAPQAPAPKAEAAPAKTPAPKAGAAPAKTPAPKAPAKLKKQPAYYDDEPSNPQSAARNPAAQTPAKPKAAAVVVTKPKADPNAELRADLLANKRADDAARAAAERKRQEAEEFSRNLKSTTRKGGNKTGYDAYKSLMGE